MTAPTPDLPSETIEWLMRFKRAVERGETIHLYDKEALLPSPPHRPAPMIFLGIDPGQSGGIAGIDSLGAYSWKMPETERDIWEWFNREEPVALAVIERVHSMPGQGVASSFKFGRSYGFLRGCLVAAAIPFEEVSPAVWQKALGCLTKGDKNVSKAKAQQLFPALKITHATADALLLATYARRLYLSRNGKPTA